MGLQAALPNKTYKALLFWQATMMGGTYIDSIVTYVAVSEFNWELSSVDLEANRWVDGDSLHTYKRFALNLII